MGGKKAKRTKVKRIAPNKIETRFDCLKCNHEKVVQCKIMKGENKGYAFCTVCEAKYVCPAHSLDRPIDIYHYWADKIHKEK